MRFSLSTLAWSTLVTNLGVIIWGAWVRVTGSGAGCGRHWPLCNGEALPRAPSTETLIELTHRVTSGLALLLVLLLFFGVRRRYGAGSHERRLAGASLVFVCIEALVGAALVLFELVGTNDSTARALVIAVHLVNSLLLVGALLLTGRALARGAVQERAGRVRREMTQRQLGQGQLEQGPALPATSGHRAGALERTRFLADTALCARSRLYERLFRVALIAVLLVGASGAVAALGDTLFPSASLAEGLRADFSPTAHVLIRTRIWHPLLAVITGMFLIALSCPFFFAEAPVNQGRTRLRSAATALTALVVTQLLIGFINLFLLAPAWAQLVHLLFANLVWIALLFLRAEVQDAVVEARASIAARQPRAGAEVLAEVEPAAAREANAAR